MFERFCHLLPYAIEYFTIIVILSYTAGKISKHFSKNKSP